MFKTILLLAAVLALAHPATAAPDAAIDRDTVSNATSP